MVNQAGLSRISSMYRGCKCAVPKPWSSRLFLYWNLSVHFYSYSYYTLAKWPRTRSYVLFLSFIIYFHQLLHILIHLLYIFFFSHLFHFLGSLSPTLIKLDSFTCMFVHVHWFTCIFCTCNSFHSFIFVPFIFLLLFFLDLIIDFNWFP